MSTLSKQLVALFAVIIFSMAMYGCGGGGSSGPAMTTDDDDGGDDDTAMTCPEGQTGTYPDCMAPGPTAEEIAATTKAAGTKRKAIEGWTSDGSPGGITAHMIAISRDRDGTEVKITVDGAGKDDPKFMQTMDLGSGTTMHSLTMEADDDGDVVEEVMIVTTDIKAPKATAFAKVEGPPNQELNHDFDPDVDADSDGTPENDFTALKVNQASEDVLKLIMSSAFPTNRGATLNFNGDNAGTPADEAEEVAGTFNGAMGTYRCTASAGCSVTIADADDGTAGVQLGIDTISDGWVFIPDEGATSDVADSDYLHYGVWLKKTTDEDGVVTYNEVETFAGATGLARSDIGSIRGKATYSGSATGVYVHSVVKPDGKEASATSGHFAADAELTAYFNQATAANDPGAPAGCTEAACNFIAPNLLNSLSGTIDNFMLSGHDEGPGWSVSLENAMTDGTGAEPHVGAGVTKGGGNNGAYTATFHGPTADNTQPSSVVGEFNAFFSNGAVAGSFGATKDSE